MFKVTVCVVVYNAIEHINECLNSLLQQDYPRDLYEILVIDNDSTDGTQERIQEFCNRAPHIRMLVNPIIGIAGSRNMGLREARYDYVAFTDSDCVAPPQWLSRLVQGFERHRKRHNNLASVGGSNVPPENGDRFYNTLSIFLNTFLGSHGSVQGKRFDHDRVVPHIPTVNIMYHRKTVLQAGGFDVTFGNIGEDQDMSYRLRHLGYTFVYLANCPVTHKLRPTRRAWLKNMRLYGKGRMWLMRKHPDNIDVILLAPLVLVVSLPLSIFAAWHAIFFLPLLYFPLILLISAFECVRVGKPSSLLSLFGLYVGTHFAYGVGEIIGLFKNREMQKAALYTSQHARN